MGKFSITTKQRVSPPALTGCALRRALRRDRHACSQGHHRTRDSRCDRDGSTTPGSSDRGRRTQLGRNGSMRIGRELVGQHRQRFLRWTPIHPGHVGRERRRRITRRREPRRADTCRAQCDAHPRNRCLARLRWSNRIRGIDVPRDGGLDSSRKSAPSVHRVARPSDVRTR
jgi:hypothetical protein